MDPIDIIFISVTGLVLYVTFLFVLLFFRNKKKMDLIPNIEKLPTVTILVPAYNEEKNIKHSIENLNNLNYPKKFLEIIVIDDHSTDSTANIAKSMEKHLDVGSFRVITNDKKGKAEALNFGLKHAKGDFIVVVDADSYPEKNSLLESIPFFDEDDVMAVTTKILVKNDHNFLGRLQALEYSLISWTRKLSEYIEGIYVTPGPFALYRKKVFDKIGYFDPKNATEDIEIAWRILSRGYKIKMSPAKAYTNAPEKWKQWVKQRLRWNIGGMQTTAKYKSFMFRKGPSSFKFYVIPFFTLSYFVTFLSLSLFMYLGYLWLYKNLTFIISAYLVGVDPFKHYVFTFLPDLFLYFGAVLIIATTFIIYVGMKDMKIKQKSWPYVAFYLTFYITIFPFLMAYSIIKYAQGYNDW